MLKRALFSQYMNHHLLGCRLLAMVGRCAAFEPRFPFHQVFHINSTSGVMIVARVFPDNSRLYYLGNALGSVHQGINDAQGIVNEQLTNAWGQDLAFSQTVSDRHGYEQREQDQESGLIHFRARAYDLRLGRFAQKDPLMLEANPYLHARANPLRFVDPRGTDTEEELMKELEKVAAKVSEEDKSLYYKDKKKFGERVHAKFEVGNSKKWKRPMSFEPHIFETTDGEFYYAPSGEADKLPESVKKKLKQPQPVAKPDVVVWKQGVKVEPGMKVTKGMAEAIFHVNPEKISPAQTKRHEKIFGVKTKALPYRAFVAVSRGACRSPNCLRGLVVLCGG